MRKPNERRDRVFVITWAANAKPVPSALILLVRTNSGKKVITEAAADAGQVRRQVAVIGNELPGQSGKSLPVPIKGRMLYHSSETGRIKPTISVMTTPEIK